MTDQEIIHKRLEDCSPRAGMVPDPATPTNNPEHVEAHDLPRSGCSLGFLFSRRFPDPEWEVPDTVLIRQILNIYFYTFRKDDHVHLVVGIPEGRKADLLGRVEEWIETAKLENNFCSLPSFSMATVADDEEQRAAFVAACDQVLGVEHVAMGAMFNAYRTQMGANMLNKYEYDNFVDLYDINKVIEARSRGNKTYGSTDLTKVYPLLDYVSSQRENLHNVLDVGCGAGAVYDLIRRYCRSKEIPLPSYTGLDYSRAQVLRAQRNYPNGAFHLGSAMKIPYADRSFSLSFAHSVLSFVPAEQQLKAISELLRVSRDGSFFSLVCQASDTPLSVAETMNYRILQSATDTRTVSLHYPDLGSVIKVLENCESVVVETDHQFMMVGANKNGVSISGKTDREQYELLKQVAADMRIRLNNGEPVESLKVSVSSIGEARLFEFIDVEVYPKSWWETRFRVMDTETDNYLYFN